MAQGRCDVRGTLRYREQHGAWYRAGHNQCGRQAESSDRLAAQLLGTARGEAATLSENGRPSTNEMPIDVSIISNSTVSRRVRLFKPAV